MYQMFLLACFGLQVIGIAVFFALLMKPVAVEETEEIEQVLLGKKNIIMHSIICQKCLSCTSIGIVVTVLKNLMLALSEQCFMHYICSLQFFMPL